AENGQRIASVPQISLTLSLRALVRGLVAPTAIEVFGPHLYLRRGADGRFSVAGIDTDDTDKETEEDTGGASEPAGAGGNVFAAMMNELMDEPEPGTLTGYLSQASVVGGRVTLDDERLGLTWEAPEANFSIRRGPAGLTGELAVAVEQLGHPA